MLDATLHVISGAKRVSIRLKLPLVIGRSSEAALTVRSSATSRQHCEIYEESGMLVVRDLGSSNGTYIGDERLTEPTFLYAGEHLRVGKVIFQADYPMPDPRSIDRLRTHDQLGEGASDADDSVILDYSQDEDGSFLGIDVPEIGPPSRSTGVVDTPHIDTGHDVPSSVAATDPDFHQFLRKLDE